MEGRRHVGFIVVAAMIMLSSVPFVSADNDIASSSIMLDGQTENGNVTLKRQSAVGQREQFVRQNLWQIFGWIF